MKPNPAHRKSIIGFTLVEVLVVIVIIAVLAAILFPLGKSIRDRAHTATCTTNLRTLSVAFNMYSAENNGGLPSSYYGAGGWWFGELGPYVGIDIIDKDAIYKGQRPPGPFACPAAQGLIRTVGSQASDFGYNRNIPKFEDARVGFVLKVSKPSQFIINAGTGEAGSKTTGDRELGNSGVASRLTTRHRGKCNFLYLDGHVETLDPTKLPTGTKDPWKWKS